MARVRSYGAIRRRVAVVSAVAAVAVLAVGASIVGAPAASATTPILSTTPITLYATKGLPFAGSVGKFKETPATHTVSSFTAVISWGDGTHSTGVVSGTTGTFTVSGQHTYAVGGFSTVQAAITGPGVEATTIVSTASVQVQGVSTISGTEGALFTGTVATFSEPSASHLGTDYTATIDWGDGVTDTATISGGTGTKTISEQSGHIYADEGSFTINIAVALSGNPPFPLVTHATMADADHIVAATAKTVAPKAGVTFSGPVATFTSTAPIVASNTAASIDWGDGTTTVGTVTQSFESYTVSGTHSFFEPGTYAMHATLREASPGTAGATEPIAAHVGGVTAGSAFVSAAYNDFVGRNPTSTELGTWAGPIDKGTTSRSLLVNSLSTSSEWVSAIVNHLYLDTLGRVGDPSGVVYWTNQIRNGNVTVTQASAAFYRSNEYFNGFGHGTVSGWLTDMWPKVIGRTITSGELTTWTAKTAQSGRGVVALQLYNSSSSCHVRVNRLYLSLLDRLPDTAGADYWAAKVAAQGDLALAVNLSSSNEYYHRARVRFP